MSSSVAPASTATAASWAFTAGWWAPLGKPITAATADADAERPVSGQLRRRHAHGGHPEVGRLLAQRHDVLGGGLGPQQRVVDQRGERGRGPSPAIMPGWT